MKIIKYRAWSEKIGAFIYWQSDQDSSLGMFWELCQSEGLEPEMGFDFRKGDITIYEEDIIKQQNLYNADIYIGKVKRNYEGRWCLDMGNHVPSITSNYLIIGNTHENPELLPKK